MEQKSKLYSCKYPIWMTQKPKKGNFRELKSKKMYRGMMPPDPPISLRRRRSFRKSVSIHPRSVLGTCSSTAWEVGPSEALPSSFESQELWAGSDRKRVGLWIHLDLLTDRPHANNISFPKERELLKILTVLSMESTGMEKSFSCIWRIHNWLRNAMTIERLTDLAVIAMHGKSSYHR